MAVYHVSNGQVSGGIVLNGNDGLSVSSGGTANDTVLHSGASLTVLDGNVSSTIVSSGGNLIVSEGAVTAATIHSGGSMILSFAGKVTGTLTYSRGHTFPHLSGPSSTSIFPVGKPEEKFW